MASVYILYSKNLDCCYTGSCLSLNDRLVEHEAKAYTNSFTAKTDDWELFYSIDNLPYQLARAIEKHIKRMKSKKYIENLKKYDEISIKLIALYENEAG